MHAQLAASRVITLGTMVWRGIVRRRRKVCWYCRPDGHAVGDHVGRDGMALHRCNGYAVCERR